MTLGSKPSRDTARARLFAASKTSKSAARPQRCELIHIPLGKVIARPLGMKLLGVPIVALVLTSLAAWTPIAAGHRGQTKHSGGAIAPAERQSLIARARVWESTDVQSMDLLTGPTTHKPFRFDESVTCTYLDKKLTGLTPKFACRIDPDDEVKVKIGGANGEVYAEVVSTRLLWALGFGADAMYSTRVLCHGCPETVSGVIERNETDRIFDPAAIERKLPGEEIEGGWSWRELDNVEEKNGATRAERDGLKLLAAFIQHSDSKPEQQRLICLDKKEHDAKGEGGKDAKNGGSPECDRPFMYINDLGVTFGRANRWNANAAGSMNLVEWSRTPVWLDPERCVGNLPKSYTGTLDNPVIGEDGRQFLADLLMRLTDRQLHDMFTAGRVELRLRNPEDVFSGFPSIDEWVDAFKTKRNQIASLRCSAS
jgi:hypothetical protein